jgi:hypothetical protein
MPFDASSMGPLRLQERKPGLLSGISAFPDGLDKIEDARRL